VLTMNIVFIILIMNLDYMIFLGIEVKKKSVLNLRA
jgi:hypothetical protein